MSDPLRDSREAKIFTFLILKFEYITLFILKFIKNFRNIRNIRDMYSKFKIGFLRIFGLDSKRL